MIQFKTLSTVTALLCGALFIVLLLTPEFIFWTFSLADHETARFISRRAGILFLGFAIIFYFGRHSPPSSLRHVVSLGIAISLAGLALLGIIELLRGFAGYGILLAITVEILLSAAYFLILHTERSMPPTTPQDTDKNI